MSKAIHNIPIVKAVRFGCCGTCPQLLIQFIQACNKAGSRLSRQDERRLQIEVLCVLLDTVCDSMIDDCWRGWCLDNACHPLSAIRRLSYTREDKRELARLEREMRELSRYFLN